MNLKNKTVFVVGGAGFIGSHLVDAVVRECDNVVVIDDLSGGNLGNLKQSWDKIQFEQCDITNLEHLQEVFVKHNPNIVFNQAASKCTVCLNDVYRDLEVNAKGVLSLLELSHKYNVEKFIHASSGSIYGYEQFPSPKSHYGVSKLAGDAYVRMYKSVYGLDTVVLRYYHVYGPRQTYQEGKGGVVGIFFRQAIEGKPLTVFGGQQAKTFTYVDDIVRVNLAALDIESRKGINVSCGKQFSVLQLSEKINKIANNHHVTILDSTNEPKKLFVDNAQATQVVGNWTELNAGLQRSYKWYQSKLQS